MFGNNFNKPPEKKVGSVAALEREPSKEELIETKLEKLNISRQELDKSIEDAGGMEKVSQYLKENGNIDLWKHDSDSSKVANILTYGVTPALIMTIVAMLVSNFDNNTVTIATAIPATIGSIYGFIKAKQEKRKAQTVDVLMDVAGTERKNWTENYTDYMDRLTQEELKEKEQKEKDKEMYLDAQERRSEALK